MTSFIHGNALDLSELDPAGYEAVLVMGPLYHLLSREERVQAVLEAMRVLKPGGRLFAAFITLFAPFRAAARADPDWYVENDEYAHQILKTGVHDQTKKMAKVYFIHPEVVVPLMESCGARTLLLVGCEGIAAGHEERINDLGGDAWQMWVDLDYRLGQEPSLHGASDHLLYVGEKSG